MDQVIFKESDNQTDNSTIIKSPKIDGYHIQKLKEHMTEDNPESTVFNIIANSQKVLECLVDPSLKGKNTRKVLCLGKVQSGKTAFFIGAIALAFDNGYSIAYVIGGTKNDLCKQNYDRITSEFSNNPFIKVIYSNEKTNEEVEKMINDGNKIVVVSLKNATAQTSNLSGIFSYCSYFSNEPSIVIDDEVDEYTPGKTNKQKTGNVGRTHDAIVDVLQSLSCATFLGVTATPQANLLSSTLEYLSPDNLIMVEPGDGYTGGNEFHDSIYNEHVVTVLDTDDFKTSIPDTFKEALNFYLFGIFYKRCTETKIKKYSMLVHPSSLTRIQKDVKNKIVNYLENSILKILSNKLSLGYKQLLLNIYNCGFDAVNYFDDFDDFINKVEPILSDVIKNIKVYEFNVGFTGKLSMAEDKDDEHLYKIKVGGNILGRGLTIDGLTVTYIYRDAKIAAIDTMYQRARWFGYKQKYFDICRVYMTKELKEKFIDIVNNENDMWASLNSFLLTNTNIKKFDRVFRLDNDKLILTRRTITKTVQLYNVNTSYVYNKSINLSDSDRLSNKNLYYSFLNNHKLDGKAIQFGTNASQTNFVIDMKYSTFINEFILKYVFPIGSSGVSPRLLNNILYAINEGEMEDFVHIMVMRYRTGQERATIASGLAVKELTQGYNNGTNYPGDRNLGKYAKEFTIQIHPVYINKKNPEEIIPLLAMTNPISGFSIRKRLVTGDNYYESDQIHNKY